MIRTPWAIPAAALAALALARCASAPPDLSGARSGDFTLGVTVLRDQALGRTSPDARYIVDAGGVLHASFGEGSRPDTHPGFTRRLDADLLDAIWDLAGGITRDNPAGEGTPAFRPGEPVRASAGREAIIVELRATGSRRVITLGLDDARGDRLVGMLGSLAWADEIAGSVGGRDRAAPED